MPTLRFVLKGQYITRIDSLAPVAKSRNYFYAHFDFQTPEWTGIKTALSVSYTHLDVYKRQT